MRGCVRATDRQRRVRSSPRVWVCTSDTADKSSQACSRACTWRMIIQVADHCYGHGCCIQRQHAVMPRTHTMKSRVVCVRSLYPHSRCITIACMHLSTRVSCSERVVRRPSVSWTLDAFRYADVCNSRIKVHARVSPHGRGAQYQGLTWCCSSLFSSVRLSTSLQFHAIEQAERVCR